MDHSRALNWLFWVQKLAKNQRAHARARSSVFASFSLDGPWRTPISTTAIVAFSIQNRSGMETADSHISEYKAAAYEVTTFTHIAIAKRSQFTAQYLVCK